MEPIGGRVWGLAVGATSVARLVAVNYRVINGARCVSGKLVLALSHTSLLGLMRSNATPTVLPNLVFSM